MVIDDEPDAVVMLLQLLRLEGYDAHGFASGRAALSALLEVNPDVVVCDVAMPTYSGWDVAREIRSVMGVRRPMLVAVSGQYVKEADRLIGRSAGFDYYFTKPYTPEALLELIAKNRRR
jgi:DNA-binding response OmpR family regulator